MLRLFGPLVLRLVGTFGLALVLGGCATLVRGSSEPIEVQVEQDSAYVFVDGVPVGEAPGAFRLRRSRAHRVEVVRDGHRIALARVGRTLNPFAAGAGFLFGGFSGIAVDAATGAIFDLSPDVLRVELRPDSAGRDAVTVAHRLAAAREAGEAGFPAADPDRRAGPPWLVVQTGTGVFGAETAAAGGGQDEGSGGLGVGIVVGRRTPAAVVVGRALAGRGFLFDNSERWELALLAGPEVESFDGRVRLAVSAGAGVSGGRGNSVCVLCDGSPRDRRRAALPTRAGLAGQLDVFVFPVPQVGLGVQLPVNYRAGDTAWGLLMGVRFEGM